LCQHEQREKRESIPDRTGWTARHRATLPAWIWRSRSD
jgi:hypothetical protein